VKRYSPERKEAVLRKLLPPYSLSVPVVAKQEGISIGALYNWRNQAKFKGAVVPGPSKTSDSWSSEAKLAVVIESASLNEAELSQYCREKGLYPEQVRSWKQDCLDGFESSPEQKRQELKQAKADKKRVRKLEKELHRKEKALAEAAALLVLRKKLKAFYGEETEDD
jgi:transposase-like protein